MHTESKGRERLWWARGGLQARRKQNRGTEAWGVREMAAWGVREMATCVPVGADGT